MTQCLAIFLFFSAALGWFMMVRGTLVARRKATLCLQLWLETTASSSGPPAAASISAASSGWSHCCIQEHQWCYLGILLCLSSYIWNMDALLCPEPPRRPVWWMSQSKSVSTSTPKSFQDSCMMQTRSASGSLVPKPNCAAWILSRWDILYHIRHGSAVNTPKKSHFRTSVSCNTHICSLDDCAAWLGFYNSPWFLHKSLEVPAPDPSLKCILSFQWKYPDCPPSLLVVVYRPFYLAHSWMLIHM